MPTFAGGRSFAAADSKVRVHREIVMRRASYVHAAVLLSACGSADHGAPMLVDAGADAQVISSPDDADPGTTGDDAGGGVVVHCSKVMFASTALPTYPTGMFPTAVVVRDVNRDGKPDIVVANGEGASVSVLLGKGDGTFGAKTDAATGTSPAALVVVDVNKDGNLDIVVANKQGGTVSVLLGNGNGTFRAKVDYPTNALPSAVAVADVDRDGNADLVVANDNSDIVGAVSVLGGKGDGTFKPKIDLATGSFPGTVAVADLNKDGKADIVATSGLDSTANVILGNGNGNGTFQVKADYFLRRDAVPSAVALVDVNHDGKLDIVVADVETNWVIVLIGKGDGTFLGAVSYLGGLRPQGLAVVDVTGDGVADVVVADLDGDAMSVLAGKGDGTFLDKVDYPVGTMPAAIAVGDVDGDGVPDVVVANQDAAKVTVLIAQCVP